MANESCPFQVCRLSHSSYFSSSFSRREKEHLESLPFPLTYVENQKDVSPSSPLIWITNTDSKPHRLSPSLLAQTRLIVHPNSGYDNFPVSFVLQSTFPIIIGNTIRAAPVLEFILSCLFHHLTPLPLEKSWNSVRQWPRTLLAHQKILLIGKGHIGSKLQQVLAPLVSQLHIYDPFKDLPHLPPLNQEGKRDIDIVILCASLNPSDHDLIDQEFLQTLPSHLLLINAARGQLVKEMDLVHFLQKNPRSCAYLDVHTKEPYDSSLYQGLRNVRLFSHIAGVSMHLEEEMLQFERNVIYDFLSNEQDGKISSAFLERYRSLNLIHRLDPTGRFLL